MTAVLHRLNLAGDKMKLTKQGQNLLAKCLAESFELHFTKFVIGDGDFDYDTESVYELAALKNWRMDLPIVDCRVIGDGTAEITAQLSNAEVNVGFACREHGLIAQDENGNEILYSYRNVGNEYDFIPSYTGSAVKNIFLSEICEIRDAENVTAVIDLSVAYVNTDDFKAHVESSHPHLNTPNHYDDVATTSEIWATDAGDNHLHKIKIENLRELLKDDTEKISEQDKIATAQNELGLAANILMIEDFADDTVNDSFKSKVRSYAEHGNLLGIESPQNLKTGANYILCDGVFSESVTIASVLKNNGGYYARLKNNVANTYNTANLFLYRTTPAPCNKNEINWRGAEFSGVRANFTRTLELENYIEVVGNGNFVDGYFCI